MTLTVLHHMIVSSVGLMPAFVFPWKSNATRQALEIARAKHERRLFPVACTRLFGWERPRAASGYALSLNLVPLLGLLPHGASPHVAPLPAPT